MWGFGLGRLGRFGLGVGFRVWCVRFRILAWGFGFRVWGVGFRRIDTCHLGFWRLWTETTPIYVENESTLGSFL